MRSAKRPYTSDTDLACVWRAQASGPSCHGEGARASQPTRPPRDRVNSSWCPLPEYTLSPPAVGSLTGWRPLIGRAYPLSVADNRESAEGGAGGGAAHGGARELEAQGGGHFGQGGRGHSGGAGEGAGALQQDEDEREGGEGTRMGGHPHRQEHRGQAQGAGGRRTLDGGPEG
eukprot:1182150-Prorocentrum_minimum.AAC.2